MILCCPLDYCGRYATVVASLTVQDGVVSERVVGTCLTAHFLSACILEDCLNPTATNQVLTLRHYDNSEGRPYLFVDQREVTVPSSFLISRGPRSTPQPYRNRTKGLNRNGNVKKSAAMPDLQNADGRDKMHGAKRFSFEAGRPELDIRVSYMAISANKA